MVLQTVRFVGRASLFFNKTEIIRALRAKDGSFYPHFFSREIILLLRSNFSYSELIKAQIVSWHAFEIYEVAPFKYYRSLEDFEQNILTDFVTMPRLSFLREKIEIKTSVLATSA